MNAFVKAVGLVNSSCSQSCGNVSIPYPFGIEPGCYISDSYRIDCNHSFSPPKPMFTTFTQFEVLDISLDGTLRVNYPRFFSCSNGTKTKPFDSLAARSLVFSQSRNRFIAIGCDNFASLNDAEDVVICGCMSVCDNKAINRGNGCNGINCCQTTIPSDLQDFSLSLKPIDPNHPSSTCKYAFIVEQMWFETNLTSPSDIQNMSHVPVVLEWLIDSTLSSLVLGNSFSREYDDINSTYSCATHSSSLGSQKALTCSCKPGFEGNPYFPDPQVPERCTDIDECIGSPCSSSSFHCVNTIGSYQCLIIEPPRTKTYAIAIVISTCLGLLFLLIGGWWSYKVIMKRKNIKRKEKFFKRNGGLLLQQQLSSGEANVEKTKLFNSKDLEKATDHFNVNRILGQGGQGTVYKGMLVDGKIVAVKKSKVIDEEKQLEEFINEVVILSQINHRNVVKLLGCCLETEVPLLVYEFIPNGTLSQYLHVQNEEFPSTWDMRLRIATEVAGALFYLHSAASLPIYHRDIKSTNILLDDKYRAKIADFGTSRSIAIDQTHLTTVVQGTFGYLDPEYFQSSQFTEKSDVYSFGVVLVELLTGEKAISSTRTPEIKSLATYFIHAMEENNFLDIIDAQVMKDSKKEEIIAVANLAKMCLNLSGKKRPTMKEVAMQLEAIQTLRTTPNVQQNYEEVENVRSEMYEQWDVISTSTMSGADSGVASSSDAHPLLSF
ncbi:wall-associated receptor kinase-like 10 [Castanea sativa]|uniref:wall-associated receptor kinase-like 10 n=1 Tax=Castanea sativa TaxID=21020 RepID=UPI003F64CE9F